MSFDKLEAFSAWKLHKYTQAFSEIEESIYECSILGEDGVWGRTTYGATPELAIERALNFVDDNLSKLARDFVASGSFEDLLLNTQELSVFLAKRFPDTDDEQRYVIAENIRILRSPDLPKMLKSAQAYLEVSKVRVPMTVDYISKILWQDGWLSESATQDQYRSLAELVVWLHGCQSEV